MTPTYWTISTIDTHRYRRCLGSAGCARACIRTVSTASTGINSAIDIVTEIRSKLVTAYEGSVDKTKLNDEITELKDQLRSVGGRRASMASIG